MKKLYINVRQLGPEGTSQSFGFKIGQECMLKHLDELENLLKTMSGSEYKYEVNAERTHHFEPDPNSDGCLRCPKQIYDAVHG
jgi:hypothetical protein